MPSSRKQEEEQRAAELRAAYLQARRERKTVSTLRENALREFQTEQSRREQAEMDEIVSWENCCIHRSAQTKLNRLTHTGQESMTEI